MTIRTTVSAVLVLALAAGLLAAGCSKASPPASTGSSGTATTASSPASILPSAGASSGPGATSSASEQQAEADALAQAQKDITDLENELKSIDDGLNSDPTTEGDVNP